ncbi:MAG TPA: OmpH family outer membrane protein [Verrucomicrobiae bacterium]
MKNCRLFIILVVSTLVAVSATAQTPAPSKIACVDMKKLFSGYWKTKQAEDILDKEKTDAQKNVKAMADDIDKATADYKQLAMQADDPAISADERTKRKQAVEEKAKSINDSKGAFQQFQRTASASLQEKAQRMSGNVVVEIQKAVSDKAKLGGYTLVVNSSSPEAIVYVSPDCDITASVLSQLNAGAPIDVSPSAATGALPLNISTNLP